MTEHKIPEHHEQAAQPRAIRKRRQLSPCTHASGAGLILRRRLLFPRPVL